MQYNIEEVNTLIKSRRSHFPNQLDATKKVDDAVIQQILVNATWAPSHGQTEPWKFIVFSNEGRQTLANFQAELYKKETDNFKETVYQNLLANPLKASHVIALCLKRDPAKKFPEVEEVAAVSCAVQNIYLSVTAYGLGGYWTTGGPTYKDSAKDFFGLTADDKLLGFFYIGHITVPSPAGKRKPIEEKIVWIHK